LKTFPKNARAGFSIGNRKSAIENLMQLVPAQYAIFPVIDAALNGTSAVLLVIGRWFIKQRNMAAHRAVMLAAMVSSSLFLICYLYYHYHVGSIHFQGQGIWRPIYFTLLTTHTILAAVIVPMVIITLSRGLRARFDKHRRIARWTFPLWLYVSITGVVIYFMLYQIFST
jgi:uncharacterized membrane protein YozB (DUF420 family)